MTVGVLVMAYLSAEPVPSSPAPALESSLRRRIEDLS